MLEPMEEYEPQKPVEKPKLTNLLTYKYHGNNRYEKYDNLKTPADLKTHEKLLHLGYELMPREQLSAKTRAYDYYVRERHDNPHKHSYREYACLQTINGAFTEVILFQALAEFDDHHERACKKIAAYQTAKRG